MIVKVCGMREAENIRAVEQAGADWMGFIFHPGSPRRVDSPPAYLPARCRRVGVFVDGTFEDILGQVRLFGLHLVQLHGRESPALCRHLRAEGLGVIKAFAVGGEDDFHATVPYEGAADYFLFDAPSPAYGGSGRRFSWELLRAYRGRVPFLLSGGLGPDCADDLRRLSAPCLAGVDLNSRFETAPGLKDAALVKRFVEQLKTS